MASRKHAQFIKWFFLVLAIAFFLMALGLFLHAG